MTPVILLCDDELHILESVSYVAKQAGFRVVAAREGAEALELAKKERPMILVLDVMLPRMSGLEVCRAVKETPELEGAHVIMLSARGQEGDEDEGYAAGADDYMTKPFSPRKLRQKFESILKEKTVG